MFRKLLAVLILSAALTACKKNDNPGQEENEIKEDLATFKEIASIDLGGTASSEISAYDPSSKRLFVVNNENSSIVEVLDLSKYPVITKLSPISFSGSNGVNSVAVHNGFLAAALEGPDKQDNGTIAVINASSLQEVKRITVGALPDMVTFSPDGNYIISANEGEPNDLYTVDPNGSVSVIDVKNNYAVKTLDFSAYESTKANLIANGFRVFGLNADVAKDVEPEYVTVSSDSKKAWVTLQENNALAEIDLISGTISKVTPLGLKDISLAANAFDVSDKDDKIQLGTWPINAFYLPDALSYFSVNNTGYIALANEGDTRAYAGFDEEVRVSALSLDPVKFPNAATLQTAANLGRLTVTRAQGDTDADGDYDELYATGGRGVTILNAQTGQLIADLGKGLEERVIAAGKYDDSRSDNKGVEVEAVTVQAINGKLICFIGMERADMIAVYDVSNPAMPKFLQLFATGDAPEGVLYVKPKDSPNGKSLLIVSSEEDGKVSFYQPDTL